LDANTLATRDLFGSDRRYLVPLFQRPYVWQRKQQWAPLWDDVQRIADARADGERTMPHFLGALVLDQVPNPTGHLETRLVVDGQQRLTTLQLLLEAFADITEGLEVEGYARALRKLTRNEDPLAKDENHVFKVWPTNADQEVFRTVMLAEDGEAVKDRFPETLPLLAEAYLFFHDRIHRWLRPAKAGFEDRVEALYDAVRTQLRYVVIDLTNEDDAQVIFETLNARGTPLLPADLIKNVLFHQARKNDEDLQLLYDRYWVQFDEDGAVWRMVRGRGHAARPVIDTYLQNYLSLRTRDVVAVSHLYSEYQDYMRTEVPGAVEEELERIRRYSEVFRSFEDFDPTSREGRFLNRLHAVNVTTAVPFLLALFDEYGEDRSTLVEVLDILESFLVRRFVANVTTRGYGRLFVELIPLLYQEKEPPALAITRILSESEVDVRRWPTDNEFKQAWTTRPLYGRIAQMRIRMLLEALEIGLRTRKSEDLHFREKLTLEHLMPQAWQAHYPLPGVRTDVEEIQEREALLHTIGNLTLLTSSLNPAVSNGPWEEKRPEILNHSALALNRSLMDKDTWNEDRIRERGEALFKVAREIWPPPPTSL
jgi:hypothetical protein